MLYNKSDTPTLEYRLNKERSNAKHRSLKFLTNQQGYCVLKLL
jgi:hypothetical protein